MIQRFTILAPTWLSRLAVVIQGINAGLMKLPDQYKTLIHAHSRHYAMYCFTVVANSVVSHLAEAPRRPGGKHERGKEERTTQWMCRQKADTRAQPSKG